MTRIHASPRRGSVRSQVTAIRASSQAAGPNWTFSLCTIGRSRRLLDPIVGIFAKSATIQKVEDSRKSDRLIQASMETILPDCLHDCGSSPAVEPLVSFRFHTCRPPSRSVATDSIQCFSHVRICHRRAITPIDHDLSQAILAPAVNQQPRITAYFDVIWVF